MRTLAQVKYHSNRIELISPFYQESVEPWITPVNENLYVISYYGTEIPLYQISYWNVENQICFATIEEILRYKKEQSI